MDPSRATTLRRKATERLQALQSACDNAAGTADETAEKRLVVTQRERRWLQGALATRRIVRPRQMLGDFLKRVKLRRVNLSAAGEGYSSIKTYRTEHMAEMVRKIRAHLEHAQRARRVMGSVIFIVARGVRWNQDQLHY